MKAKRAIVDFINPRECPFMTSHYKCRLKSAGCDDCLKGFPHDCPLPDVPIR